jgi:hypothetical protein
MTGDNPVSGYEGFENPDEEYYGTSPSLPILFTGTYQVRQFGVGGAATTGASVNVLSALESPPAAMTTAASHALSGTVVTSNDINHYYPHTTANPNQ